VTNWLIGLGLLTVVSGALRRERRSPCPVAGPIRAPRPGGHRSNKAESWGNV